MYLDFLDNSDEHYNWGSAGIAYLYHHLDDACRKTSQKPCMGGCIWGLSIWMWEHFLLGRRERDHDSPIPLVGLDNVQDVFRLPTVAFSWDKVKIFWRNKESLYKSFINEMDNHKYRLVNWRTYEAQRGFMLDQMCTRDIHLWRIRCPQICICCRVASTTSSGIEIW